MAPSLASRSVEAASLGERWGGGRFLRELWRRACTWSNSAASALVTALKSEPVRSQRNCTSRARSRAPHVHAPCGHASYLLGICQHGVFATIAATATRGRRPCPPAPMPVPAPNFGPSNSLHTTTGSRFPGAAPRARGSLPPADGECLHVLMESGGLMEQHAYSYTGAVGLSCFDPSRIVVRIANFTAVPAGEDGHIWALLVHRRPSGGGAPRAVNADVRGRVSCPLICPSAWGQLWRAPRQLRCARVRGAAAGLLALLGHQELMGEQGEKGYYLFVDD